MGAGRPGTCPSTETLRRVIELSGDGLRSIGLRYVASQSCTTKLTGCGVHDREKVVFFPSAGSRSNYSK
jgi:hypothetical protein